MIAPSKHAIGITSNNGIEILIHVGLDTVNLKGNGFEVLISENDNVEIGQTLLRFNQSDIEKQGYNTITPIIVTNSDDFEEILIEDRNEVTDKDNIMTIIKNKGENDNV